MMYGCAPLDVVDDTEVQYKLLYVPEWQGCKLLFDVVGGAYGRGVAVCGVVKLFRHFHKD